MIKLKIKFWVGFIFLFFLCLTQVSLAKAEEATSTDEIQVLNKEIAGRKDKIKQLEDTMEKYKKNIAQKQTETISLHNQLSILDARVTQVATDIQLTQEKIKTAELEIEALEISIKDKENTIQKQKAIIAKIVQNIHAQDQKNFFEIMLSYSNFADFYNEVKYVENVYVDLGRSVKALEVSQDELKNKKGQVDDRQKIYRALQSQLQNKQQDLQEQTNFKQKLLVETKDSETKFRTLLSSLKQQYQVIENEVQTFEERIRKRLAEQDKIKASRDVVMSWPVPSRVINATFHDPNYPFRNVFEHSGIDIRAAHGTPVRAAASGYVARARHCASASCYSYVIIVHTVNISSVYGHLSSIATADDAFVNRGDIIGYSGGTPGTVGAGPFVTGPHLHFEVRLNGIPVDPMPYMAP